MGDIPEGNISKSHPFMLIGADIRPLAAGLTAGALASSRKPISFTSVAASQKMPAKFQRSGG